MKIYSLSEKVVYSFNRHIHCNMFRQENGGHHGVILQLYWYSNKIYTFILSRGEASMSGLLFYISVAQPEDGCNLPKERFCDE
jgi:hypothetical protein